MYLVIDIGGTYTKYGYYNQDGECISSHKQKSVKTNLNDFYQAIIDLVVPQIKGIALSMPGLLNSQTGDVHAVTAFPFLIGHNIKEELEERLHIPTTIENDAKCAALGEIWKGNLQKTCNGLMMVIGSGIGGTIILNGQIVNSPHYKAGEIGSLLMPKDCSYQEMTNFGKNNNANELIHSISEKIHCKKDGPTVFQYIEKDETAYHIFKQYCRQIAFMIYNLDYILDLDTVCIGGGISEQDIFITTVQEQFSQLRNEYKEDKHEPLIQACAFHNEANLLGALYHHLKKLS